MSMASNFSCGGLVASIFAVLYLQLFCKVSLTDTITNAMQLADAIGKQNLPDEDALMAGLKLSDIFPPPQPIGGFVHIIVRLPASSREFSSFLSSTCLKPSFRQSLHHHSLLSLLYEFPKVQVRSFDLFGTYEIVAPAKTGPRLPVPGPPG